MPKPFVFVASVGNKFGKWVVIDDSASWFVVRCECGQEKKVRRDFLFRGLSRGCTRCMNKTHGMERTPVYQAWSAMKSRCLNAKNTQYANYGGRGIKVCERWLKFENFYQDMGSRPEGMSLDRTNNDGDYEPSNCKWVTVKEQIRNRRVTPKYMVNGILKSLAQIAEEYGIPRRRLYARMLKGWAIEDAIAVVKANRWRKDIS